MRTCLLNAHMLKNICLPLQSFLDIITIYNHYYIFLVVNYFNPFSATARKLGIVAIFLKNHGFGCKAWTPYRPMCSKLSEAL